jgi:hypothetical protein
MLLMSDDAAKKWIKETLRASGGKKTQAGLARELGVHPSQITQLLAGTRRLQFAEWQKIITFLEKMPPSHIHIAQPMEENSLVPLLGQIQAGVWRERRVMQANILKEIPKIPGSRYSHLQQYAYEMGDDSGDKIMACTGSFLICVNFIEACPSGPSDGDWVLVRHFLKSHGRKQEKILFREAPYIVRLKGGRTVLESAAKACDDREDITYTQPTDTLQIVSLIIGIFTIPGHNRALL